MENKLITIVRPRADVPRELARMALARHLLAMGNIADAASRGDIGAQLVLGGGRW